MSTVAALSDLIVCRVARMQIVPLLVLSVCSLGTPAQIKYDAEEAAAAVGAGSHTAHSSSSRHSRLTPTVVAAAATATAAIAIEW